jgi:hypothetical protein
VTSSVPSIYTGVSQDVDLDGNLLLAYTRPSDTACPGIDPSHPCYETVLRMFSANGGEHLQVTSEANRSVQVSGYPAVAAGTTTFTAEASNRLDADSADLHTEIITVQTPSLTDSARRNRVFDMAGLP